MPTATALDVAIAHVDNLQKDTEESIFLLKPSLDVFFARCKWATPKGMVFSWDILRRMPTKHGPLNSAMPEFPMVAEALWDQAKETWDFTGVMGSLPIPAGFIEINEGAGKVIDLVQDRYGKIVEACRNDLHRGLVLGKTVSGQSIYGLPDLLPIATGATRHGIADTAEGRSAASTTTDDIATWWMPYVYDSTSLSQTWGANAPDIIEDIAVELQNRRLNFGADETGTRVNAGRGLIGLLGTTAWLQLARHADARTQFTRDVYGGTKGITISTDTLNYQHIPFFRDPLLDGFAATGSRRGYILDPAGFTVISPQTGNVGPHKIFKVRKWMSENPQAFMMSVVGSLQIVCRHAYVHSVISNMP